MALRAKVFSKAFHFGFSARTSRGLMLDRTCWFIKIWNEHTPEIFGLGECAPIQGLSPDYQQDGEMINRIATLINSKSLEIDAQDLVGIGTFITVTFKAEKIDQFPSVLFALECALLDLIHGGKRVVFENKFSSGHKIPINGLIWMGGMDFMLQQVEIKIYDGFRCVKLKVGGLDFERECDILQYIRRKYYKMDITVRLDANGAIKPEEALYKLKELSKFKIHSIEQPLKPGHELLPELCKESPIPIALDEEMIGVRGRDEKKKLLERIKPKYIVLKPTLHGGLSGTKEWIEIAEKSNIGWWLTSALESNVGLNALCQFSSEFDSEIPQGLGTGHIYEDNVQSPLQVKTGLIFQNPSNSWELDEFN